MNRRDLMKKSFMSSAFLALGGASFAFGSDQRGKGCKPVPKKGDPRGDGPHQIVSDPCPDGTS